MSESLVIIRTYGEYLDADEAQVELLSAGIYSLLFSDGNSTTPPAARSSAIALAVHPAPAVVEGGGAAGEVIGRLGKNGASPREAEMLRCIRHRRDEQ